MENRIIKLSVFLSSLLVFTALLFSQTRSILELYRLAPKNLLSTKHNIVKKGNKYIGTIAGEASEGVVYTINTTTNRMESTQEYFRDAHLGVTTFAAKQTDKRGNDYLVIYFDNVTGGTGVKSSEIKVLQFNRGKWKNLTASVIPDIGIVQFMKNGFDKKLLKKLSGASGVFIKEYKLPLQTSQYISVGITATWLPSQVQPPLHEVISEVSGNIEYSFILKWNANKAKYEIFKKVKKDELAFQFETLFAR